MRLLRPGGDGKRRPVCNGLPLGQEAEKLGPFAQTTFGDVLVLQHGFHNAGDGARAEVVALVEFLQRLADLVRSQARIFEDGILDTGSRDELIALEMAVLLRPVIQFGAGIGRSEGHLDAEDVEFASEAHRLLDRLTSFAGQAEDEGAVDDDAELVAVLRELARFVNADALLDIVEDLLIARFVTDEQQTQSVVLENLQRLVVYVRAGIARPGDAECAQFLRNLARPWQVSGERVIIEEELLHLGKEFPGPFHFLKHVFGTACPVSMPANGLRPEAKGALGGAATTRVERNVRMLQITDEVLLDLEVALVDIYDERQVVHVFDQFALGIVDDLAIVTVAYAADGLERLVLSNVVECEVELLASHKIYGLRSVQCLLRQHGSVGANKADEQLWVALLQFFRGPAVVE